MVNSLALKFTLSFIHPFLLVAFLNSHLAAQAIGELAEMNRLEKQADELIAQADPEGAAQAIGKAAMMADILTQTAQEQSTRSVFKAAALQYRAQERGLRALALFERTGANPPAPDGVCHYLIQANTKLLDSKTLLEQTSHVFEEGMQTRRDNLVQRNEEWKNIFQGLQRDFECPNVLGTLPSGEDP